MRLGPAWRERFLISEIGLIGCKCSLFDGLCNCFVGRVTDLKRLFDAL